MSDKFQDVVIVYKDLTTGREHSRKEHFKVGKRDKMLKNLVAFENPKVRDRARLIRVKFYDFYGNKVKESFGAGQFSSIEGYSDVLKEMQFRWKREEDIDLLLK